MEIQSDAASSAGSVTVNDLVERVAEAICTALGEPPLCDDRCGCVGARTYLQCQFGFGPEFLARAAIEAMLPSEAELKAAGCDDDQSGAPYVCDPHYLKSQIGYWLKAALGKTDR